MQNTKRLSLYFFILKLVRIVVSFLTLSLSAKFFALSIERDIWILTSAFIMSVNLAVWGPINETFRAKFVLLKEVNGELYALKSSASLISFIIVLSVALSFLLFVFSHRIGVFIAPSYSSSEYLLFYSMLYILIPSLIINELVLIFTSILNAYESFYVPEVVGTFTGLLGIFTLYIFAPLIGIYSLFISQYLNILILLVVLFFFMKKKKITFWKYLLPIDFSLVKPYVLFSIPFFLPYFAGQCSLLIEKVLSNTLGEGVVSLIDYSSKYTYQIQAILTSLLSTMMVPILTKYYARKDAVNFSYAFKENFTVLLIVISLVIPYLFASSFLINKLLYFRGEMHLNDIYIISSLTRIYSISLISTMLYIFLGLTLLSQGKGKFYAACGLFTQLIFICISVIFYRSIGIYTFVIANLVATFFSVFLLALKLKALSLNENIKNLLRYLLFMCLLTITLYYFIDIIITPFVENVFYALLVSTLFYSFIYIFYSELLGFHFLRSFKSKLNVLFKWKL